MPGNQSKVLDNILTMKIEPPSVEHKDQFFRMLEDFEKHDAENAGFYYAAREDFDAYIKSLLDEENGLNLKPGFVPCTHRWLLDDLENIVGVVRIRHIISTKFLSENGGHIGYDVAPSFRRKGFGTKLLKYGLSEAKNIGLDRVLVITDKNNIGSIKVIENNDGQYESTVLSEYYGNPIVRYWIHLNKG